MYYTKTYNALVKQPMSKQAANEWLQDPELWKRIGGTAVGAILGGALGGRRNLLLGLLSGGLLGGVAGDLMSDNSYIKQLFSSDKKDLTDTSTNEKAILGKDFDLFGKKKTPYAGRVAGTLGGAGTAIATSKRVLTDSKDLMRSSAAAMRGSFNKDKLPTEMLRNLSREGGFRLKKYIEQQFPNVPPAERQRLFEDIMNQRGIDNAAKAYKQLDKVNNIARTIDKYTVDLMDPLAAKGQNLFARLKHRGLNFADPRVQNRLLQANNKLLNSNGYRWAKGGLRTGLYAGAGYGLGRFVDWLAGTAGSIR